MSRGGHSLSALHVGPLLRWWWNQCRAQADGEWPALSGEPGEELSLEVWVLQTEGLAQAKAGMCDIVTASEKGEQFALAWGGSVIVERRLAESWKEIDEAGDTSSEEPLMMQ